MINYITHIHEPRRLILSWQAINSTERTRHVVGELTHEQNHFMLTYLINTPDCIEAIKLGFQGYPAYPITKQKYSDGIKETFMRRLPPRNRQDFEEYLKQKRISPEDGKTMSDFSLLGYTGAKLLNDPFELVYLFEDVNPPFEFLIEIAGFRYNSEIPVNQLQVNMPLLFSTEPDNEYETNAIKVICNEKKLGYIDHVRIPLIQRLLTTNLQFQAHIEKINGNPERPLVYALVEVR